MNTIKLLFHIAASKDKVFDALSSANGIANWWTTETSGDGTQGGMLTLSFGEMVMTLRVREAIAPAKVVWECFTGMPEWIGTLITFELDDNDGKTRVRFSHAGFKEADDVYASTTTGWARFMNSLRQYCQTGIGEAFGSPSYQLYF